MLASRLKPFTGGKRPFKASGRCPLRNVRTPAALGVPIDVMNWSSWKSYFEINGSRPLPKVSAAGTPTDEEIRGSLARTFSVFQLGEAGEGRIAREAKSFESESIDDDWRNSLAMWVREEGRHGRVLGDCARALGGKPLYENWTNRLLIFGRRLLGLRLKLLVILCAEVIGITFYGFIARALPSSDIGAALAFISREETHHLRFHARFFHLQTRSRWRRALFLVAWWSVGTLAGFAVLVDHRTTLRLLEISKAKVARAFVDLLLETSRAIAMGRDPEAPEMIPNRRVLLERDFCCRPSANEPAQERDRFQHRGQGS